MNQGVQHTVIGDLPTDWEINKIKHLGGENRPAVKAGPFGSSLKKEFYVEKGYKIYGQEQVISEDPFFGDYYIDEKRFKSLKSCEVLPGDILISLVGTVGKVLVIPENAEPGIINPRLLRLTFDKNRVETEFAKYYLSSPQIQRLLLRYSQGGTMGVLNAGILSELPFLLPPVPEQRKIADILSTWDEAIAKTEQLIAALGRRKKGLMQRLLTGEVRFAGFEKSKDKQETKFGIIPTDWQVKKFSQVGKVNADTLGNGRNGKKYHYIELSAVDKGNITFPEETIAFSDLPSRARRIPHKNDVIMATVRPNLLAYATWDDELSDYLFSTGFALITPKLADDKDFIYYSLYGELIQRQIHGLVTGSNYPAINSTELKGLILFWPSNSEERKKIGEVFRMLDEEIKLHTRKLSLLQQQKKGLMQRLLTGLVRVKIDK